MVQAQKIKTPSEGLYDGREEIWKTPGLYHDQRRVWVKQDWYECFVSNDSSRKKAKDASGKLSSDAISEILDLFVQLVEEKNATLKEKAKTAVPTAGELAADLTFNTRTRAAV